MQPLLSIVIPFYNSELKCQRLLATLQELPSTDSDIEVILVDDGSTDGTLPLLESAAQNFSIPYKLISQCNKGPGGAWNYGISKSTGAWVWCVGSDDDIVPGIFNHIREIHQANDLIDFVDFDYHTGGKVTNSMRLEPGTYIADRSLRLALMQSFGRICTKIVRREFLEQAEFPYPEFCVYEDNPVSLVLATKTTKFIKASEMAYIHHEDFDSVTRGAINDRFFDRLHTSRLWLSWASENITDVDETAMAKLRFRRLFLLTTVGVLLKQRPGHTWLDAARVMKYYRTLEPDTSALVMAELPESKKYQAAFRVLWALSHLLGDVETHFRRRRSAAWPSAETLQCR